MGSRTGKSVIEVTAEEVETNTDTGGSKGESKNSKQPPSGLRFVIGEVPIRSSNFPEPPGKGLQSWRGGRRRRGIRGRGLLCSGGCERFGVFPVTQGNGRHGQMLEKERWRRRREGEEVGWTRRAKCVVTCSRGGIHNHGWSILLLLLLGFAAFAAAEEEELKGLGLKW